MLFVSLSHSKWCISYFAFWIITTGRSCIDVIDVKCAWKSWRYLWLYEYEIENRNIKMNDKKRKCEVLDKQNFEPKYRMVYDIITPTQIATFEYCYQWFKLSVSISPKELTLSGFQCQLIILYNLIWYLKWTKGNSIKKHI